ncbi:transcriptional regulator GutM [Brevibacillus massiliensis]|jgi:glucitol operon activator protein|uniref:transcriptional regulator GutM n=1 Tax=Brevibacillus massiliensis TaxID=1118054 RepID=UPI0002D4E321|nr:transcriptional regulator GutM [Brevibacillus massiliensis]
MLAQWGVFIAIFAALWVLQIGLTVVQSNHFKQQFHELRQQVSGFLGVGVSKKRFGTGAVVILVTDEHGQVTRCRQMAGVSVFARFREVSGLIGKSLEECRVAAPKGPKQIALNMAIDKIKQEQAKQQNVEVAAERIG